MRPGFLPLLAVLPSGGLPVKDPAATSKMGRSQLGWRQKAESSWVTPGAGPGGVLCKHLSKYSLEYGTDSTLKKNPSTQKLAHTRPWHLRKTQGEPRQEDPDAKMPAGNSKALSANCRHGSQRLSKHKTSWNPSPGTEGPRSGLFSPRSSLCKQRLGDERSCWQEPEPATVTLSHQGRGRGQNVGTIELGMERNL